MGSGSEGGEVARRATASGIGGLIGTALGGPVGAVVGAAAGVALEPLVDRVWGEVAADGRRRGIQVVSTAADLSGETPENFAERMGATEETRLLSGSAISAATRTTYQPKLDALARALSNGLADDAARVDEEQLFIAALADLEAPHAVLLDLLVNYEFGRERGENGIVAVAVPAERGRPQWTTGQIAAVRAGIASVLPGLLGSLQRHGLAVSNDNLAKAFEDYGKKVEKATRQAQRTRSSAGQVTTKSPSSFELRRMVPEALWSATDQGVRLLEYLTGRNTSSVEAGE